jgi:pyruvate formate lyase activating enzyme
MKVNLGDIIPTSTLDLPGKVVMSIFFRGCPLRCPYCSNSQFIDAGNDNVPVDITKVTGEILKAKDFIDGVIFSGGEPFVQQEALFTIARYVKSLGLLVGVQTNGIYPDRLKAMSDEGLLDAVLLDIKAPLELDVYVSVTGYHGPCNIAKALKTTIGHCNMLRRENRLKYFEARTTIFTDISDTLEDLIKITFYLDNCDSYVLQQGRPEIAMDESIKCKSPVTRLQLRELASMLKVHISAQKIRKISVRTREMGDEVI